MGSRWLLLLLLLLLRDRALNLPGRAFVWVIASDPPSRKGFVLNRNLSCPSTSSGVPHNTKAHISTEELSSPSVTETPTSKSQEQMTAAMLPASPEGSCETHHEPPASAAHTPAGTATTDSPSLSDSTVAATVKEPLGAPQTTVLSSLAPPPESPPPNLTVPSSAPDKANDNEPSTNTSSASTTTLRATEGSATSGAQGRDTTPVPSHTATTPTKGKPPDTQHSSVPQTPSQPAQTGSNVSTILVPEVSPPKPTTPGVRSSVSPEEADTAVTTPSMASSTAEDASPPSGTGTPTEPKTLTPTPPSPTLDKVGDINKPLPVTTSAATNTTSPTPATLNTAASETQDRDTAAGPPTPATTPTTSKPPDTHQDSVTRTPSQPAPTGSSVGSGAAQSPNHSTARAPSSSDTTTSSTVTSKAPPGSSQSSAPGGGTCALDEYLASPGGCMCNDSYYPDLELSREIATLRCRPRDIEVTLRSCFLKTRHWALKNETLTCFSINRIEQGHRVQVFQLEKKEGTCGLHLATNASHALHSLDVHLEQALPGASNTSFKVLQLSCAYPLVVNASKPVSSQEVSILTNHVPSTGELAFTLSIFTDPELSTPLKNSTAPVGMTLYVVLKCTNSDPAQFALVANEVFASTNQSNTEAEATHHFVKDSCPVRGRMLQDLTNGASIYVTLAFTLSRFLNSDTLYLHAQVTLCDKQAGRPCQPSCSGKNPLRRSSPWDARAGTHVEPGGGKWIVFGPLRISESRASSSWSPAGAWMSIFLLILIGWMLE
ncbi:mucin-2-like [Psammomys obesus]|uniref:mucin-2-like n=1 Tax=Psammomys obesus TaxID=48139 RepID=UPI002453653E|nr:mucin-2-like [Psammomys obesus]